MNLHDVSVDEQTVNKDRIDKLFIVHNKDTYIDIIWVDNNTTASRVTSPFGNNKTMKHLTSE